MPNKQDSCEDLEHPDLKLTFEMQPTPDSSAFVRAMTRTFVQRRICEEHTEACLLAVHEAVTNCIRHARTPYRIQLIDDYEDIVIVVRDSGSCPFNGNDYIPPLPGTHEGKMGVPMMLALMDSAVWSTDGGTTVTLRKTKQ